MKKNKKKKEQNQKKKKKILQKKFTIAILLQKLFTKENVISYFFSFSLFFFCF